MNKKGLAVTVSLSGEDLQSFNRIKKALYAGNDAEVLRICMRFYDENFHMVQTLEEHGLKKEEIENIPERLKELTELEKQLRELWEKIKMKNLS